MTGTDKRATVEDVGTIFERKNDATIYIPTLEYVEKL